MVAAVIVFLRMRNLKENKTSKKEYALGNMGKCKAF